MFWKHLHPGKVMPPRPFPPPPPPTPYQLHAQNQFHAGCCNFVQTPCPICGQWPVECKCGGVVTVTTSGGCYTWPASEPALVVSESAARAIVAAIDDNRPHRAAHLIKELPWFAEILSGVRATRHLKPVDYITLSERPWALMQSL